MEHFCSAVALAFGEAQPGDTYTCGVRIECELHIILGHDSARVGAAWRYNRGAVTASPHIGAAGDYVGTRGHPHQPHNRGAVADPAKRL